MYMKWIKSSERLPDQHGGVYVCSKLGDDFVYDMYHWRNNDKRFVCSETSNPVRVPEYWCWPTNPELQQLN